MARSFRQTTSLQRLSLLTVLTALAVANMLGAPYYLAPSIARPRHAWHQWLKPSGTLGQAAGILAFVIFAFLWLYPMRKRWRALAWSGAVGRWLDVHIATALMLPLLLTLHAAWRAEGVIGLGFGAMLVVCASGIVGRYLYVRIPRARSGLALTREEVVAEQQRILSELATALNEPVESLRRSIEPPVRPHRNHVLGVLKGLLLSDLNRWKRRRSLARQWRERGVPHSTIANAVSVASREMALAEQLRMLEATQRVFRYWHIAHMPFALTALIAVTIHVIVVVVLGQTWFW